MVQKLLSTYKSLGRDIDALSNVLLLFMVGLLTRAIVLIYRTEYEELGGLVGSITALVAALLVAKTAAHLIKSADIARENQRRMDVIRVTHHLLVITTDLRNRVGYLRFTLNLGGRSVFEIARISESIEHRYEALFDREIYKVVPGKSINEIIAISGSIYGIANLAKFMTQRTNAAPFVAIESLIGAELPKQILALDNLESEIQHLIDEIYKVRADLEPTTPL